MPPSQGLVELVPPIHQLACSLQFLVRVTLLVALGLHPLALGAPAQATGTPPLRIGFLLPPGEPAAQALRAAVEDAAQDTAAYSPGTSVVVRGRTGQWGDDGTEAARLALDDQVQGLITPPDGTATHLVLQVAGRTALPVVSLCPDSSVVGSGLPWLVQIVPDTQSQARALMLELAPKTSSHTVWAALVPGHRAGREIKRDLETVALSFPGIELRTIDVQAQEDNATAWLAKLTAQKPSVVLLWLDAQPAAQCASQLRRGGYAGVLAGPERLRSSRFLDAAGQDAERFVVPVPLDLQEPIPGDKTITDPVTAYARDAVLLLQWWYRRQGHSPEGAPARLRELPPVRGCTGEIVFDRDGRRTLSLALQTCSNGSWHPRLPTPLPSL